MTHPATNEDIERGVLWVINAQVASLKARRDKARSYPYNTNMQIEAELCQAQIDVLEKYLKEIKL